MALAEDVGAGDATTALTVPRGMIGHAVIRQKQPGVIFGHDCAEAVFVELDPTVEYARLRDNGAYSDAAADVARVSGPMAALLTGERTALNFLMHLSGVATTASAAVNAVVGTGCAILDTRKTTPGMRMLEKAAVAAGGAANHRTGLYDAILIKENHIAAAGGVGPAVRACLGNSDLAVEVEVRDSGEIEQALAAGDRRLLLDNMTNEELRAAVEQVGGRAELEASGGYRLDNVRAAAETGVDFISMGSITHGAPALDLSMVVDGG
ncbi:MAG: carboxylating nicotinate-nucleotide diphosphorylase [Thermoleophilia bacterium]|nr:carboxylating nicotinate-nucleotide diphosphorylase [Thermoleophilia bacterium]